MTRVRRYGARFGPDAAISFIVGDTKPRESVAMISATERALSAGIAAAGPGARIGDISHAIGTGRQSVEQFGGITLS